MAGWGREMAVKMWRGCKTEVVKGQLSEKCKKLKFIYCLLSNFNGIWWQSQEIVEKLEILQKINFSINKNSKVLN